MSNAKATEATKAPPLIRNLRRKIAITQKLESKILKPIRKRQLEEFDNLRSALQKEAIRLCPYKIGEKITIGSNDFYAGDISYAFQKKAWEYHYYAYYWQIKLFSYIENKHGRYVDELKPVVSVQGYMFDSIEGYDPNY